MNPITEQHARDAGLAELHDVHMEKGAIVGTVIYFLSDYNWEKGFLIGETKKNLKINIPPNVFFRGAIRYIPKEKCATLGESVCVVWEQWKGKNGRGGYRVERELYPEVRVPAEQVHYQHVGGKGRVDETAYGVKR